MPSSTCRNCRAPIRWRETPNGKWQPIVGDGTLLFLSCPERPSRPRLPDDQCIACGSTNVEQGPGAGPHFARLRCLDCQSLRWLPHPVTP